MKKAFALCAVLVAASAAAQTGNPTCAPQQWPREALRYELEGKVRLGFRVTPEGQVSEARVTKSSGWALLDDASVAAVKTCRFAPDRAAAMQGGEMPVEYVWTLGGDSIRPSLVPGSCVASGPIDGFQPFDTRPTDASGVKVRFLVDGNGKPHGIKLEGHPDAALAGQVERHLDTCRFAFDPASAGMRTDTMTGRVLLR